VTVVEVLQALVAVQRLLDSLISLAVERAKAQDRELLNQAISEARLTRTSEGKSEAARKMRQAISGDSGPQLPPSGNV
jgi:hypothetical protein